MRRETGGGQSQLQGGHEDLLPPKLIPFLNLQNRAGPHTAKAETTANITRQYLTQVPDLLDILHATRTISPVCVCVCALRCNRRDTGGI